MSTIDDLLVVARNYAWAWNLEWRQVLADAVGPDWAGAGHPYAALLDLVQNEADIANTISAWDQARPDLAARAAAAATEVRALQAESADEQQPDIAYFSPEFGVSETLPQYSGGLGILAGDHLKAASDLSISLIGVGLFYTNGYFTQGVDDNGQLVAYDTYDPQRLGLTDTGVMVDLEVPKGSVSARVWLANVGRVRLYLLDTQVDTNEDWAAAITDRLYGGDQQHRIDQEWVLGYGGAQALRQLGITPGGIHLNEGHAGFSLLEIYRRRLEHGDTWEQAQDWVRRRTLFTTHTPVPAGIDRFPHELIAPYLQIWSDAVDAADVSAEALLPLGHMPSEGNPGAASNEFNMAAFCLRSAGMANGVSALHGSVSRSLFSSLEQSGAITSVTNGVHARTWTTPSVQRFFDTHLGRDWSEGSEQAWSQAASLDSDAIVALRGEGRRDLVEMLHQRGFEGLDPEALTIGFARRFATYKRAALLLSERERLEALLANTDRPVQFVFAGKAHPADLPGQAVLADVVAFGATEAANARFVFVPGYDMHIASALYGGCDVWLNNPVRPQEACGTSGEKSALNGGINCSILDGWWAEWYDEANGWAIPISNDPDPEKRDKIEADGLLSLLEGDVVPSFYADGERRPSEQWVERIRAGWTYLGPKVTAARMVADYDQRLYRRLAVELAS